MSKNPEKLSHLILLDAAGVYTESKKRNRSAKVSKLFAPLKRFKLLRKIYHKLLGASDYDRAPENMKKTLTNMINSDRELSLEAVATPTTILWGKLDAVTPPSDAEKLNEKLPSSTLKFYANWRHAPYIDDPAGLARALNTVLENIIAAKSQPAPRVAPEPKAPKNTRRVR